MLLTLVVAALLIVLAVTKLVRIRHYFKSCPECRGLLAYDATRCKHCGQPV
mgnify:CR=1 FL=1